MMNTIAIFLLLVFTCFVTVPMRYTQGRTDGIKYCIEKPQDCKTEYQHIQYEENKK